MATAPTTETVSSPLGGAARFVESRPTALIIAATLLLNPIVRGVSGGQVLIVTAKKLPA